MMKKITAVAVLTAMTAWSGTASAADLGRSMKDEPYQAPLPTSNYILNSNNQLSIQFSAVNFDYKETVNGAPFDTEKNWVPGVGGSLSYMGNLLVPNLYLNAQFSWYNGKTDYVGAYQGQPFGSLTTTTGATVTDFDFRVGKGFEAGRNVMVTPYFGIGTHDWDRKVNGGEEYSNGYYGAGLMLQFSPVDRLVLSATGLIGQTFGSQIDISTFQNLQGSTLDLGNSTIYRVGLSADYAITRNIHVNAGVEWVDFKYGQSALDPTGQYLEPDSRTSNVVTKVGVGYAFGGGYESLK